MALGARLDIPKRPRAPNPPLKIESRVGIMAPPEPIWEVIANINGWPTWNPTYPSAAGELHIGSRVAMTVALPGEPHRQIEPRVLDWVPFEQMLLSDLNWGGWVKSVRYIEIEHVDTNACIVSNGELFQGWVSEIYGAKHRRPLKRGFTAMSEALKREAEKLWADQQRGKK